MASTPEVLSSKTLATLLHSQPSLSFPVLIPTSRHLDTLLNLPAMLHSPPVCDTVSVFLSASESFSRANLGCTIAESVTRIRPVVEEALRNGLRVRGYLSVVLGCPFGGRIHVAQVESVARELIDMGCYEVSLGDTIGVSTPSGWEALVNRLSKTVGVERMAVSVLAALERQLDPLLMFVCSPDPCTRYLRLGRRQCSHRSQGEPAAHIHVHSRVPRLTPRFSAARHPNSRLLDRRSWWLPLLPRSDRERRVRGRAVRARVVGLLDRRAAATQRRRRFRRLAGGRSSRTRV